MSANQNHLLFDLFKYTGGNKHKGSFVDQFNWRKTPIDPKTDTLYTEFNHDNIKFNPLNYLLYTSHLDLAQEFLDFIKNKRLSLKSNTDQKESFEKEETYYGSIMNHTCIISAKQEMTPLMLFFYRQDSSNFSGNAIRLLIDNKANLTQRTNLGTALDFYFTARYQTMSKGNMDIMDSPVEPAWEAYVGLDSPNFLSDTEYHFYLNEHQDLEYILCVIYAELQMKFGKINAVEDFMKIIKKDEQFYNHLPLCNSTMGIVLSYLSPEIFFKFEGYSAHLQGRNRFWLHLWKLSELAFNRNLNKAITETYNETIYKRSNLEIIDTVLEQKQKQSEELEKIELLKEIKELQDWIASHPYPIEETANNTTTISALSSSSVVEVLRLKLKQMNSIKAGKERPTEAAFVPLSSLDKKRKDFDPSLNKLRQESGWLNIQKKLLERIFSLQAGVTSKQAEVPSKTASVLPSSAVTQNQNSFVPSKRPVIFSVVPTSSSLTAPSNVLSGNSGNTTQASVSTTQPSNTNSISMTSNAVNAQTGKMSIQSLLRNFDEIGMQMQTALDATRKKTDESKTKNKV